MRPVNLIPPEERRRAVRTAPMAYLLVGTLALALGAVTMVVLANNKIADRKVTITELRQEKTAVAAQAAQLTPFVEFSQTERERTATVRSLANSRFDWERVLRELSLVLPDDVSLSTLNASATGADSGVVAVPGLGAPTLQLSGCAAGHEGVAGFLGALRDIDGVTTVNLASSKQGGGDAAATGASGVSGASGTNCGAGKFVGSFDLSAVFEAASPLASATAVPGAPTAPESTPSAAETTPASATTDPAAEGS